MDPIDNKYVRDLPLWLKWLLAAVTILGVPSIFFSTWTGYESVKNSLEQQTLQATTTPNLADIFIQNNKYERGVDQQDFLATYKNSQIVAAVSFQNIVKSGNDSYTVYGSVSTGWSSSIDISCSFGQVDDEENKRLNLLQKGQTIYLSGTFTQMIDGTTNYWYIAQCNFIN